MSIISPSICTLHMLMSKKWHTPGRYCKTCYWVLSFSKLTLETHNNITLKCRGLAKIIPSNIWRTWSITTSLAVSGPKWLKCLGQEKLTSCYAQKPIIFQIFPIVPKCSPAWTCRKKSCSFSWKIQFLMALMCHQIKQDIQIYNTEGLDMSEKNREINYWGEVCYSPLIFFLFGHAELIGDFLLMGNQSSGVFFSRGLPTTQQVNEHPLNLMQFFD